MECFDYLDIKPPIRTDQSSQTGVKAAQVKINNLILDQPQIYGRTVEQLTQPQAAVSSVNRLKYDSSK